MKADLTALLEAIRLVRAELDAQQWRQPSEAPRALSRISAIVDEPSVVRAIQNLDPMGDAPSIAASLPKDAKVH